MFPCKGCTDRTVEPNCHDRCEKYLKAKKETKHEKADEYKLYKLAQVGNENKVRGKAKI